MCGTEVVSSSCIVSLISERALSSTSSSRAPVISLATSRPLTVEGRDRERDFAIAEITGGQSQWRGGTETGTSPSLKYQEANHSEGAGPRQGLRHRRNNRRPITVEGRDRDRDFAVAEITVGQSQWRGRDRDRDLAIAEITGGQSQWKGGTETGTSPSLK